jgi:hypothetical protein
MLKSWSQNGGFKTAVTSLQSLIKKLARGAGVGQMTLLLHWGFQYKITWEAIAKILQPKRTTKLKSTHTTTQQVKIN